MYPWGHVAVAYILYSVYSWGRHRRPPGATATVAVVVGALFADIVDKPLALLGVFPGGRYVAHSLLFVPFLLAVVTILAYGFDRPESVAAFALAHLSHLLADLPPRVLQGYPFGTEYLFWPVLSRPTFFYHDQLFDPPTVVALVGQSLTDPLVMRGLEASLFVFAVALWVSDGCPAFPETVTSATTG